MVSGEEPKCAGLPARMLAQMSWNPLTVRLGVGWYACGGILLPSVTSMMKGCVVTIHDGAQKVMPDTLGQPVPLGVREQTVFGFIDLYLSEDVRGGIPPRRWLYAG